MKTPLVSLLICHCHLLSAVVEIDKSGGKDEDTIN